MNKPRNHRFKRIPKSGRKARRGQTKAVRVGSRTPGSNGQGSIRRPY